MENKEQPQFPPRVWIDRIEINEMLSMRKGYPDSSPFGVGLSLSEQRPGEGLMLISKLEVDHLISQLKAENERLRTALEFYAQKPVPDKESIFAKSADEWGESVATWEPLLDMGEKARQALGGEEG